MVSLAVEEVDKGSGWLSGAGNSGCGWLEGGGQRRRAQPGSAPTTGESVATGCFSLGLASGIGGRPGGPQASRGIGGFWSGPAATQNHHWQENRDEIRYIEVKAPWSRCPLAGFVDFPGSGKAIVEISNN